MVVKGMVRNAVMSTFKGMVTIKVSYVGCSRENQMDREQDYEYFYTPGIDSSANHTTTWLYVVDVGSMSVRYRSLFRPGGSEHLIFFISRELALAAVYLVVR